jgi:hypothetical protein
MKPFGLRLSRIPEFIRCVKLSASTPSAYRKLAKGALTVLFNRNDMPMPGTAKRRLRACLKCPHRDGGHWLLNFRNTSIYRYLKPARNGHDHLPLRCGKCYCYIPYLVSSTPPFTPCPINEEDSREGWQ